jgi:DNA polymerase III subunit beta
VKLQVTQENLNKALNSVARIANTKNALPILSNVLIKTVDSRVVVVANNLEIAITHHIGSKVSEEGSVTVPARLMQDFIASLPSGIIDLQVEDTKLHIKTGTYNSTINGTPADDYPEMPSIDGGTSWKISAVELKKALQQVVFAASNDDARPILTGVYFHTLNGKLYIAATDSYRLAEKEVISLDQEVSLLIPASAMQDLLRTLGDYDGDVTVSHDSLQVLFEVGDVELLSRLIEGTYPDYKKLIPESFSSSAVLPKSELVGITKVSSLFARESAGSVTLHLDETEKTVSIRSIASQLGENTAKATAKVTGEADITLNSRYILDALGAIHDTDIAVTFNGKLEPCVIRGTEDKQYLHLIMPLKS